MAGRREKKCRVPTKYAYKIESFNLHTSFSMKMVDERVQDTTDSNFIEVRYGKIPKVAIL